MEENKTTQTVPERGTTYYYVRGIMTYPQGFRLQETEWEGGMSDILRMAKGNFYLSEDDADDVVDMLNERVSELCRQCGHQQIMQHLKDILKEKKKKKGFDKGLHPDIIDK
jgi:TPP-dependent indolepyruvate ferredoxin oxidoreductase alpha subunit